MLQSSPIVCYRCKPSLQDLLKGLERGVFWFVGFFFLVCVCNFQLPYEPPSTPVSVGKLSILCLCLLELFVTATKFLIDNT